MRVRLPHAADAVMGLLGPPPVHELRDDDWPDVRRIYAEGIAGGDATFETDVPDRRALDRAWLPGHRWVAEADDPAPDDPAPI